jgi:hypothetical protein
MMTRDRETVTPEILAGLGGGRIAYVRPMRSEEVSSVFPNVPPIAPGLDLWALLAADGTPIMLADSREAVVMNARENDLETVSIH